MKRFLALTLISFIFLNVATTTTVAQNRTKSRKNSSAVTPQFGNTDGITARQMKNYLEFIASDELEGRDTPSRGLDIAAMYIVSHLKDWGIRPAGDNGTFYQKFPLRRVKIDGQNTKLELNGQSFAYGEDFLSSFNSASVSGSNIVYASHGWVVKSKTINPYQGIDVRGKIIVTANRLPKGVTFADLPQSNQGKDWINPSLYARMNGAKGLITFGTFENLANWISSSSTQSETGRVEFGKPSTQPAIPTVTASPRLIAALFQDEKLNGANIYSKAMMGDPVEAFDLKPTKKINLNVALKTENTHSQNVVGILEGSDPVLKNEYVAVGAHYDHVGTNPDAPGADKIWNGADDDGSGTVAVMAIAEAFSKGQRPKRSILFIWHAGEERGLWGSEYFTENPTVPLNSIIANLNIDMIGRAQSAGDENHPVNKFLPKKGEVFVIGSKMMSTELGELSETVNKSFLNLSFNYKYDDPNDPEHYFDRSDHYNYALKGIPIIFYMDGTHADYHEPSDSVEKIDFAQMEKVTRTIFATGWELANRAARPKVDKPLQAR